MWIYVGGLTFSRPLQTEQVESPSVFTLHMPKINVFPEIGRSKLFDTPEERWAAANIEF